MALVGRVDNPENTGALPAMLSGARWQERHCQPGFHIQGVRIDTASYGFRCRVAGRTLPAMV